MPSIPQRLRGFIAGFIVIVVSGTFVYFDYNTGTKHVSNTEVVSGAACSVDGATAVTNRHSHQVCRTVGGTLKWRKPLALVAPTLPTLPTAPNPTTTVTVPSSFYTAGPCALPHATTFGRGQWDTYLAGLSRTTATTFTFPAGCYYIDSEGFAFGNNMDGSHSLSDDVLQGSPGAKFVQTNTPACSDHELLYLANQNTHRIVIDGFEWIGSAPNGVGYCGANPGLFGTTQSGSNPPPSDVEVSNNTMHNTYGDGIYFANANRYEADHNVIYQVGRDDVSPVGGNDVTIENNTMSLAAGIIMDAETNPGSIDLNRLLVQNNSGDSSNTIGVGTGQNNGLLWNITAATGTAVTDVTIRNNTSTHALWLTASGTGLIDKLSFTNNTTTSNAGQIQVYENVSNVYLDGNHLGPGPPTGLIDHGSTYTSNPPTFWVWPTVCGKQTGRNTYRAGSGVATTPFRMGLLFVPGPGEEHRNDYTIPPC